jgi:hypothetical protein
MMQSSRRAEEGIRRLRKFFLTVLGNSFPLVITYGDTDSREPLLFEMLVAIKGRFE